MKNHILNKSILHYLRHLKQSDWMVEEAYKFEFANFLQCNIDFDRQTDKEVLEVLLKSQRITYDRARGVQFIIKGAKETPSTFIQLQDVSLFRQFLNDGFDAVNWKSCTMSFTVLSAWLASLFPGKLFPVPAKGIDATIGYLFGTDDFPKTGTPYILKCQPYLQQTLHELKNYPVEDIHLKLWNVFFAKHPELNIPRKTRFEQVDWVWLTQDFHVFVHRMILGLHKPKLKGTLPIEIPDDFEPVGIEGQSLLAIHMRYERDNRFIKALKEKAIKRNPMLNCEGCGFSFFEKYGVLGQGFIEAHHKQPLNESKLRVTSREDIALVCSNCHRMLHKGVAIPPDYTILTVEALKARMAD